MTSAWPLLNNAIHYAEGECTSFVASLDSWVGPFWGNGCQWAQSAQSQGLTVSKTPVPGAIAVYNCNLPGSDNAGHVAQVTSVGSNGSFTVQEANWQGFNTVDTRTDNTNNGIASQYLIGFIMPPGTATATAAQQVSDNQTPGVSGIEQDVTTLTTDLQNALVKIGLLLLGFFVVMVGIAMLMTDSKRTQLRNALNKVPLPRAQIGSAATTVADKVEVASA